MRRLIAFCLSLFVLCCAASCSSSFRFSSTSVGNASPSFGNGDVTLPEDHGSYLLSAETNTMTSLSVKYKKFSGTKTKVIRLDERNLDISVDIVTEEGSLNMKIMDSEGNSCYTGTEVATSSFTVTVEKAGDYAIIVEAEKHKGGFSLSWA